MEEFMSHTEEERLSALKCATLEYNKKKFILKVGHDLCDIFEFLDSLDFNYTKTINPEADLTGFIFFEDGTWSERHIDVSTLCAYDDLEYTGFSWRHIEQPKIPSECVDVK